MKLRIKSLTIWQGTLSQLPNVSHMLPSLFYPEAQTLELWQSLKEKLYQEDALSTNSAGSDASACWTGAVCWIGDVVQSSDQLWAFPLLSMSNTWHSGDSVVLLKLQGFHQLWVEKKKVFSWKLHTHHSTIISVEHKNETFAQHNLECNADKPGACVVKIWK